MSLSYLRFSGLATWFLLLILNTFAGPQSASGQIPEVRGWARLGSDADDRVRLDHLLYGTPTTGYLVRTPSLLLAQFDTAQNQVGSWDVTLLAPEIESVWNSDLPVSMNDGALWAGAGWNARINMGLRLRVGRATLILAPDVLFEQNAPFQFFPFAQNARPARKRHADPFHPLPESMDKPVRFGDESLTAIGPGQSSLTIRAGPVSFGAATENLWWGPGIRNGIIMSNHAAGFPHLFLRTSRPIETKIGALEGTWMLGRLAESDYFDVDPTNDTRSLSGLVVTLRPWFERDLTLGLARVVFAPTGRRSWPSEALDVFRSVGRPNSVEYAEQPPPGPDQIFAVFGRWVFSPAGFEVYGEWARFEQPASFKDFLVFPGHSQGYTTGLQWTTPKGDSGVLRVQAELTNLEPSATWRVRPVYSSYTSRVVPHGYTHRGQVIGASIGPGASSQWLAFDFIDEGFRAGVFGGRIRWDAAAQFTDVVAEPKREDVSLFWGLRAATDLYGWTLSGELSHGVRINYLFQSFYADPTGNAEGVDVANTTISMTFTKAVR